jgi:hypothetical protein
MLNGDSLAAYIRLVHQPLASAGHWATLGRVSRLLDRTTASWLTCLREFFALQFSSLDADCNDRDDGCTNLGLSNVIWPGINDLQVVGLDKQVRSIFVKSSREMGEGFASDAE